MKFSLLALAGAFVATVSAVAAPAPIPVNYSLAKRQTPALVTLTDQYLFSYSMSAFIARRNAKNPSTLDWSSDGCSASPDKPLGFEFLPSCHRHDFGYRQYKIQNRWNEANRLKIDNQFKKDLYEHCNTKGAIAAAACRGIADIYYAAVRQFGASNARWNVDDVVVAGVIAW